MPKENGKMLTGLGIEFFLSAGCAASLTYSLLDRRLLASGVLWQLLNIDTAAVV